MIELSRHIENLLLQHDCVIIPGLGGLITECVAARYVEEEHLLLPPYRSVGFRPDMTFPDGLLALSYMKAYDTGYPAAIRLVNAAVEQIKEKLREEGRFELPGIGTLTENAQGDYGFEPCEAGVVAPELYGLDAVAATPREGAEAKQKGAKKIGVKRSERSYTFSISRELVNYSAAACAAIAFFVLWSIPVNLDTQMRRQSSEAASPIEQFFTPSKRTTATETALPVQPKQTAEKPAATAAPTTANAPQEKAQEAPAARGYVIVLASSITLRNAENFTARLKAQGYDEARPYKHGKMVRVVYGNYPTEDEAQQTLRSLRKNKDFCDAWVMKATNF